MAAATTTVRVRHPGDVQWSYYGPTQRCAPDDGTAQSAACAARLDTLMAAGAELELRRLADEGDRCAFVALMEMLVVADRIDDLRSMAVGGDGRALATLMESLARSGREEELRAEVARFEAVGWLLDYLRDRGRAAEAVVELDVWLADRPDRQEAWRGRRLDILLEAGRVDDVRRAAAAGDRAAARRLRRLDSQ